MKRRYTDNERAVYVELLIAAGWPDKKGALSVTAQRAGVPESTLRDWANQTNNPAPTEIRVEKRFDLQVAIRAELEGIFSDRHPQRDEASYRDLSVAAGILIEKDQLLAGGATNRTELVEAVGVVRGRIGSLATRLREGEGVSGTGDNGNGRSGTHL